MTDTSGGPLAGLDNYRIRSLTEQVHRYIDPTTGEYRSSPPTEYRDPRSTVVTHTYISGHEVQQWPRKIALFRSRWEKRPKEVRAAILALAFPPSTDEHGEPKEHSMTTLEDMIATLLSRSEQAVGDLGADHLHHSVYVDAVRTASTLIGEVLTDEGLDALRVGHAVSVERGRAGVMRQPTYRRGLVDALSAVLSHKASAQAGRPVVVSPETARRVLDSRPASGAVFVSDACTDPDDAIDQAIRRVEAVDRAEAEHEPRQPGPNPRRCFYILEHERAEGGYIPVVITEGISGYQVASGNGDYARPWVWGPTRADALRLCEEVNRKNFGLTAEDTMYIVAGWLAAANPATDAEEA